VAALMLAMLAATLGLRGGAAAPLSVEPVG
jgi:hypothetical protein